MIRRIAILLAAFCCIASGHELRPAFLDITETDPETYQVLWKVPANGPTELITLRVLFDDAVQTLAPPSETATEDSTISRWSITRPGGLAGSSVTILGLSATFTDALVRVSLLNAAPQTFLLKPDHPTCTILGSPTGLSLARTYFRLGVEHILLGIDHLLFVLGLLLLVDRRRMLVKTVTSFTIAHSLTLALSTFAIITVPPEPLNAAIALSILFLGPEIVRKWRAETSITIRHPWLVAFAFGLLHGIGFASGLSLAGIPRPEIPSALLFFNVGVEAGQLAFLTLALLSAKAIRTLRLDQPKWLAKIPGYTVGSLGAYWTIQRALPILLSLFPQN